MALTYIGWIRTPRHTIWMGPPRSTKDLALVDAQARLGREQKWIDQGYEAFGEAVTSYDKANDTLSLSEWHDI